MSNSAGSLARDQESQAKRLYGDVPPVVGVSGPPGIGKSALLLAAFPRGLWIAAPGTLKPAVSVLGYAPMRVEEATTLDDVRNKVKAIVKGRGKSDHDSVVLDDFGAAVEHTEAEMAPQFKDARQLYKALGFRVRDTLKDMRDLGCSVALSTHYKEPKAQTQDRPAEEGGVALPGTLAWRVPSMTDLWLHMRADMARQPYAASLYCDLNERGTRDRHHVCITRNPPNVGELLRAAGYAIARPPGCEWHEEQVEWAATTMEQNPGQDGPVLRSLVTGLQQKNTPRWQIEWILRDALDRREIRQNLRQKRSGTFGYLGISL